MNDDEMSSAKNVLRLLREAKITLRLLKIPSSGGTVAALRQAIRVVQQKGSKTFSSEADLNTIRNEVALALPPLIKGFEEGPPLLSSNLITR
jgi:hypothetical protein